MPSILRKSVSKTIKDDESTTSSSLRTLFRRKSSNEKKGSKKKLNSSVKVPTKAPAKASVKVTKSGSVKKVADTRTLAEKTTQSEEGIKKIEVVEDDSTTEDTVDLSKASSFDDSASEGSKGSSKDIDPANILSVVLLLMDTTTRRFELVQIKVDAKRASVEDVISQIPESAGEEIKKNMKYNGVCKKNGKELDSARPASEFISGIEVLIAIPDGFDGEKTAEQASKILADPKVIDMLLSTGISLSTLQESEEGTTQGAPSKLDKELTNESLLIPDQQEPEANMSPGVTSELKFDERIKKSVAQASQEVTKLYNDAIVAMKPKLEEAQQFLKDVVDHIEESPTKYQFVLIGFLFVALCFLMYAILLSGAEQPSSVSSIAEPIDIELLEDFRGTDDKPFKTAANTVLKFVEGKVMRKKLKV